MKGLVSNNSLVQQAEQKIESQLQGDVLANYKKIVIAGWKYAVKDGANGILSHLKGSQDPVGDIVKGAVAIVGLLRRAAKGVMPVNAMVPATMTLILQGLDLAERAGMLKITPQIISQATKLFADTMLPALGLNHQKVQEMAGRASQIMGDPMKAQQIQAAMGRQMGGQ